MCFFSVAQEGPNILPGGDLTLVNGVSQGPKLIPNQPPNGVNEFLNQF